MADSRNAKPPGARSDQGLKDLERVRVFYEVGLWCRIAADAKVGQ
jgi:hypothetical protein